MATSLLLCHSPKLAKAAVIGLYTKLLSLQPSTKSATMQA
jgi:hypothetical protein